MIKLIFIHKVIIEGNLTDEQIEESLRNLIVIDRERITKINTCEHEKK